MEQLIVSLVVLVVIFVPIATLVLSLRLLRRVEALEAEQRRLRELAGAASRPGVVPAPPSAVSSAPVSAPVRAPTNEPAVVPASVRAHQTTNEPAVVPAAPSARGERSLEAFVGGRVMLVVGVIAVLFALAFFLKIAIDRGWIGPGARIAMGVAFGALMLLAGELVARRGPRTFGQALMGAGLGALYLSTYFSAVRYGFIARPTAFVLLAAVTALGAALAVWRHAPLLAWLGFLGGFLAPLLLGEDVDRLGALSAWLIVLDAGLLVVLLRRPWGGLNVMALLASALYFAHWLARWRTDERLAFASLCLAGLAFALLASCLAPALFARRALGLSSVTVVGATGLLAFAAGRDLLFPQHRYALGAAIILLGAVQSAAGWGLAVRRGTRGPEVEALWGFGMAALAIAVPVLLKGRAIAPAWAAAGVAVVNVGTRMRRQAFVLGGLGLVALSVGRLVLRDMPLHEQPFLPFLNTAFLCSLMPCAALLIAARLLRRGISSGEPDVSLLLVFLGAWLFVLPLFADLHDHFGLARERYGAGARELSLVAAGVGVAAYALLLASWSARRAGPLAALCYGPLAVSVVVAVVMLAATRRSGPMPVFNPLFLGGLAIAVGCLCVGRLVSSTGKLVTLLVALVLLLAQLTTEIRAWGDLAPLGDATRQELQFRAQVGTSAAWALYASSLLALGFRRARTELRWAGLGLFALTVLKVFLSDMAALDTIYRVGSFLVLGVLLVGASYFYQRMREAEAKAQA